LKIKRLLINILLFPVFVAFTNQKKEPEFLEIPGAEGLSIDFFKNLMGQTLQGQNIPLQQIAGMSANEQTTQGLLAKFLGTSATDSEAYKLGMGELSKTLGGEFYDPKTSDFWSGFREQSAIEEEKGVSDIRRRGQLGGGLYAEPNQRTEADYLRGTGADRQTMLGGLYEKERDRKTNAVGQALGYAGFEEAGTMNRLTAGSTIGALPRNIENQRYQAAFNQLLGQEQADYATQLAQIGIQSGAASELMPQWYVDNTQQSDPLGGILGIVGAILGGK